MKIVRMLLRVSSDQQLEADGDLNVQRQIVTEYVEKHEDWVLDEKEYFEGSNSGFKNTSADRETLQEIMEDAKKKEYDILVAYKDDRVGRLMWDTGSYIMSLKTCGVDVYTVKDNCITPELDDIMGQMMLALRYGNAQKSSADTGMRVKDTAQKLVQAGKFMGGAAPYGYELVLSGELSKHGRALHKLVIIPEKAEVVRYIYQLSLNKEYGSSRIANILNKDDYYKTMAPKDFWKSGTITSILTNPVYAGCVAYKRREKVAGKYHRLDNTDWIIANEVNESIRIIDEDLWNKTQDKRKVRSDKYIKKLEHKDVNVIRRNDGMLALIDVAYCGYCGGKLTNGSKYSYWTIKGTGEKRANKIPVYRCINAHAGIPHGKISQFRADEVEAVIFECMAEYVDKLYANQSIFEEIERNQGQEKRTVEAELKNAETALEKTKKNIEVMESHIADAMTGDYALSLEELMKVIRKQQETEKEQLEAVNEIKFKLKNMTVSNNDWLDIKEKLPNWKEVFLNADTAAKRVLVNKIIDRIDITKEQIVVRFKINLSEFQPRMSGGSPTTPYIPGSG